MFHFVILARLAFLTALGSPCKWNQPWHTLNQYLFRLHLSFDFNETWRKQVFDVISQQTRKLRQFSICLCNHWLDFNETWRVASTQRLLYILYGFLIDPSKRCRLAYMVYILLWSHCMDVIETSHNVHPSLLLIHFLLFPYNCCIHLTKLDGNKSVQFVHQVYVSGLPVKTD